MIRRPLRTYGKDTNKNRPISADTKLGSYLHNVFDSSESDSVSLESNDKNHSSTNNLFDSTFDRIARTAKLPPVPSNQNENSSILYVSSSSSSSLSDEKWIQNTDKDLLSPPKKITNRKRRKKTDADKKIRPKKTQTVNRKRANNLQIVNNDNNRTNIEVIQPLPKTRRASKEHARSTSSSSSDDSDTNSNPVILMPSTSGLKPCCVELTRVNITEPSLEQDEKSQTSMVDNENTSYSEQLAENTTQSQIPLVNQHEDNFANIKDCRIILSRLDVNSVAPSRFSLMPIPHIISSTPFNRRISSLNSKPSFSPINKESNDTICRSSIKDIEELSGIYKTTGNETDLTRSEHSPIRKSLTQQIQYDDKQTQSHNDTYSSNDERTNLSVIDDEKSTELLFESDNSFENLKVTNKGMSNDSQIQKKSMNPIEIKGKNIHPLSLSADENDSRSMFEETKLLINTVDESTPHEEGCGKTLEIQKSSINSSGMNSDIVGGNASSTIESMESNTSSVSRRIDTTNTINSTNHDSSSEDSARVSNKDTSDDSYQLHVSNSSADSNSLDAGPKETSQRKFIDVNSSDSSIASVDEDLNHTNVIEPVVLLTRLNDSVKITKRRGKNVRWNDQLGTITESFNKRPSISVPRQEDELSKRSNFDQNQESLNEDSVPMENNIPRFSRRTRSQAQTGNRLTIHDESQNDDEIRMLYLKPGKSWARSLSILNHINNENDIEMLSVGKGKKWRQSVKNVLDMQSQGALQSCMKNKENENDEYAGSVGIRRSDVTRISSSTVTGTVESTSPGRFIRRVSIRVVPDKKYSKIEDNDMKDTSFFEAYGISRSKNRRTLKSRTPSIALRDTFVYNLRCSNVNIPAIVPEPVVAARNVVLQRCNQADYVPFEECYPETFLEQCRKIGEGVYGEVFLFENKKEKSVIKIIPIEGEKLVNGEPQKKFCEILSEIIIAKELHDLRFHNLYRTSGFVEVKNIRCLIGKYPQKLIEHWQAYDEEKSSDNDCPSMFTDEQLYIALELGHGGNDLEAFVFQNANEAYSSFVQAALTLAVAEKSLDFEHRDLHWGNILISRTNDTHLSYKLDTEEVTFTCKGLKVAIIDFTLSRMSYQGCCMFNDLALDPALFTAAGEYQFEIYRLMKAKVGNNWQLFEPYTNILWLHYTLDKMITSVRYKKVTTKTHKNGILKLQEVKDELLNYDSAYDFITNCDKLSGLQRRKSTC